jgi:UDP-glucose 4-epimerase
MTSVLITGANGFVGHAVTLKLRQHQSVRAALRQRDFPLPHDVDAVEGSLSTNWDWSKALADVSAIIHCAARVHIMSESAKDPLTEFRLVNVEGTLNLARQAAQAGVRRFVFLSSIKVNGEATEAGCAFTADDVPAPSDPYGVSKLEAELGLRELSAHTGMEVVIVRPPLIYGPGVKANFASMMHWVARGVPLPLGSIYNARSMVAIDNLVDLLITCLREPAAAHQTFLVSDGQDVSTTELLRRTAKAMGKTALLLPVPVSWLEFGAALFSKQALAQRLCGSLQVDIEKNRRLLGWWPPLTLDQGLKKAVEGMIR